MAECAAGGGIERLDLGDGRAALVAGGKRSVYLMECEPVWGCVATPGRGGEMEDACAAVPRFADVPVRLLARRRDLDGLGLDADALRLPSHLFAVFDGHGGSEVRYAGDLGTEPSIGFVAISWSDHLSWLPRRCPTTSGRGSTSS
jgi:protein phosphatase 2C